MIKIVKTIMTARRPVTFEIGWRNARGEHKTPMKNPREKFSVERVERNIPRARREKLLMRRLVVLGVALEVDIRESWVRRRMRGMAISRNRMMWHKVETDLRN